MANKSRKAGDKNPSSSYSSTLKLIFFLLLIFTSIFSLFLFLPSSFLPLSTTFNLTPCPTTTTTTTSTTPSPPQQKPTEKILPNGVVQRSLYPIGTAAYNFIFMSAYRGGPHTFAIMGLSSKPLHNYGHPTYICEYQSNNKVNYKVKGKKLDFQDFGYARVYLVLVINCTFPPTGVNDPSTGGRLLLHASTNGGHDKSVNSTDTIITLTEPQNSWKPTHFLSPPKYDYLYCGGSLFGDLSQRIREWIADASLLISTCHHQDRNMHNFLSFPPNQKVELNMTLKQSRKR